ncbi:hypothetical protein M431DRAFT_282245 [Trichoderma harzianum CBS 226.95]|uniref:Uncharacterized protein n=1 Tax=Trichoderma harzianum CBS 226.95 TaxID=983964 RepID=A0A2T4AP09_TRIHA|nr:hypothetical protein M431DRAFT_282245 [Trichoderma harzianum CBS 226.95]PTB58648.1 hypothetical protein M431DRAFT_282245 [Trichoderma harzianum CBS 226.95]
MARGPITAQAPKASHRRGPTLGLNQPVTSVKRLPGPPPLKSYLRIFPRPLSRALPSSLNQSIRLRAPCRPALSNERAAQKQARPKGKKRALPALTRAIRFVRKGTNETLASASLAIHSDSTISSRSACPSRAPVSANLEPRRSRAFFQFSSDEKRTQLSACAVPCPCTLVAATATSAP